MGRTDRHTDRRIASFAVIEFPLCVDIVLLLESLKRCNNERSIDLGRRSVWTLPKCT